MGNKITPADFEAQKKEYFARSGDTEIAKGFLDRRGSMGFAVYNVSRETLFISQLYSPSRESGDFWYAVFEKMVMDNGLKTVRFLTKRNGKAMARRFGAKVVGSILEVDV